MFSKLYSSVVIVSFIEVVANAASQSPLLTGWSWFVLTLSGIPIIGMAFWAWRFNWLGVWPYLHGAMSFTALMMWPWLVINGDLLPAEFQPWVWWLVGMATISVGVTAPILVGFSYLVTISVAWFFVDTSYFGGSSDPWVSFQDSVYAFLVGGTVSGLIIMVKQAAKRTDQANSASIMSSIEQAQTDAVERERQRIDALVHDHVLNTLVLASKAESKEEQTAVLELAKDAIESLEQAAKDPETQGNVTLLGLYRALRKAAVRMAPEIQVETHVAGLTNLPTLVAQAITEATLQAVDNAQRHSKAQNIHLHLGVSSDDDLVIRIQDDGVGFKLDRIARDRIGVKISILARLKAVGAVATIDSEQMVGTTVAIRWSA
jgi:signal transduction histidine kinase